MKNLPTWGFIFAFIKYWTIVPFAIIEKGAIKYKIATIFCTSLFMSPFVWFSEIIRDRVVLSPNFAIGLAILLLADLILGIIKHLKLETFDWTEMFKGLSIKVAISVLGMAIFKTFANFEEFDTIPHIRDYIILVGKLCNFLYVGGSAFSNSYIITGGKFPPMAWMKRIKKVNSTLNLSDIVSDSKAEIEDLAKDDPILKELLEAEEAEKKEKESKNSENKDENSEENKDK